MEVLLIFDSIYQKKSRHEKAHKEDVIDCVMYSAESAEQNGLSAAVSWMKSIRVAQLLEQMRIIDFRNEKAMKELEALTKSVEDLLKSNRGGVTGIHGFIGERAHVFLSNAWALLNGEAKICELIDDNGMTDYLERDIAVQQKACRSGGWLGLDHIVKHREKYPDFCGKYHIPKDFYEMYNRIGRMSQLEAGSLSRHEWNLWLEIQALKQDRIVIEPMMVTYDEIQPERIMDTIANHQDGIEKRSDVQREAAKAEHAPSVSGCIKTAAASSAVEGLLTGSGKMIEKRIAGKKLKNFDKEDIKEIGLAIAEGSIKGAIRGTAVYLTENYTQIPGTVAGSAVTVAFDSAKALKDYADGNITPVECAEAIGKSTVVAAFGSIGAKLGEKVCPVPVIGPVVGGFLFSFIADKGFPLIAKIWKSAPIDASLQPT